MTATACGPTNKDAQPIDHATVRQALVENSSELAVKLSANLEFLEHSALLTNAVSVAVQQEEGAVPPPLPCADFDTCDYDDEGTVYEEEPYEFDTDIEADVDAVVAELERTVFNDANVEAQTETSVTYLVKGAVFCADEDGIDDTCVSNIDGAQLRLYVTSPSDGDLDIDVLIGPNRANPASFRVHHRLLGVTVDLGEVKSAANHLEVVMGEDFDLPSTFQGVISAEISATDTTVTAAAHVNSAVKINDGNFSVAVAQATDLVRALADAQAKSLELGVNVPKVTADFLVGDDYIEDGSQPESYRAGIHLGGATANVTLAADTDVVTATGVGLGGETSTFSVDGKQVLAIDVNANDGRTFDLAIAAEGDATTVEVTPKLDLRAELNFADAGDAIDAEPWLLDDVLTAQLAGAAAPKVRFGENLEVLAGTLTLALQNAGTTLTATAGQCLLDLDSSDELGDFDEPHEEPAGPLDNLEVGACF